MFNKIWDRVFGGDRNVVKIAAAERRMLIPKDYAMSAAFWSRVCNFNFYVGGSYALFHYLSWSTGVMPTWKVRAVDVFTCINNIPVSGKSIDAQIDKWCQELNSPCVTAATVYNSLYPNWIDRAAPVRTTESDKTTLAFNRAVVAVATFNVRRIEFGRDSAVDIDSSTDQLQMRLFIVDPDLAVDKSNATLWRALHELVDLPVFCNVWRDRSSTPTWSHFWNISDHLDEALAQNCLTQMSERRRKKYAERGFHFL
jgi:hypothetical protein